MTSQWGKMTEAFTPEVLTNYWHTGPAQQSAIKLRAEILELDEEWKKYESCQCEKTENRLDCWASRHPNSQFGKVCRCYCHGYVEGHSKGQ